MVTPLRAHILCTATNGLRVLYGPLKRTPCIYTLRFIPCVRNYTVIFRDTVLQKIQVFQNQLLSNFACTQTCNNHLGQISRAKTLSILHSSCLKIIPQRKSYRKAFAKGSKVSNLMAPIRAHTTQLNSVQSKAR